MAKNWKTMCKKIFTKDQDLEQEQQDFHRTYRLLLLGTKESGKTTVMRQMKILYGSGFHEQEKKAFIRDIRSYVADVMQKMVSTFTATSPVPQLENPDNLKAVDYLSRHEKYGFIPNGTTGEKHEGNKQETSQDLIPAYWDAVEILSKDTKFVSVGIHNSNLDLLDSAKYFLGRINQIRQPDYVPVEQDIVRLRSQSSNIMETVFAIDHIRYHMFDVAGQRDQRGKWLQCFNNISAIIFVVPMSGYDVLVEVEDEEGVSNRLAESLHVFTLLWNSKWLTRKSVILFLNKMDQLQEKIIGEHKLETFFPEFVNYVTPSFATSVPEDSSEFIRAKYFIRNEIMKITTASNTQHICYPHFTVAVDTENLRKVFNDCRDIIQRSQLQQTAAL